MYSVLRSVEDISDIDIPIGSDIVFDWDNTLKLYRNRILSAGVSKTRLSSWKIDKFCTLYILSAITPSKLNLDTIMLEVDRLGLRSYFVKNTDKAIVNSRYARLGNVIICGYNKAAIFSELTKDKGDHVIFFDDEKVNFIGFRGRCYLIKPFLF